MDRWSAPAVAKTYRARLRGGPDDGNALDVTSLADGEPPDFLHGEEEESGMYVLAGLPNPDGSMPYWWIPASTGLTAPRNPASSTWTLISLGDDGATRLWHQHGEDAEPVALNVEPVDGKIPTHIGRAYVCPVCQDMTVLSRPPAAVTSAEGASPEANARRLN